VVGGPDAVEVAAQVAKALHLRGEHAEPDGALAATAYWFLRETTEGRRPSAPDGEAVARRFGFVGTVYQSVAFSLDSSDAEAWRQALTQVPSNLPVTRYGVRAAAGGRYVAVVFGAVELTLAPFARHLAPGQAVELRGEISGRFQYGRLAVTLVDGKVTDTRLEGRRIQTSLTLPTAGVYRVEVLGDGSTGPVVLANVPIYVGVPEPELATGPPAPSGGAPPVIDVEARLLTLLNRDRAAAGLAPLEPDPELRSVALAHTQDMVAANFFGHVSPTTGTVDDRIRKAGVAVSMAGENVARADSAEAAHQSLMESPGHRANVLNPKYTHVGIGGAPRANASDPFLVTEVFGRRPRGPAVSSAPGEARAAVVEAIAALRRAKGLPVLTLDPALQASAEVGAQALADRTSTSPEKTLAAAGKAVARDARRRAPRRAGCATVIEVSELDQLERYALFTQAGLRRVGIAVTTRDTSGNTSLVLVVVADGGICNQPR
jgi:uncharacterized protein YkwD